MSTAMTTITISQETFKELARQAEQAKRPVGEVADELLKGQLQPTEHPYVVRREGVRGGRPILRGSGMPLWLVAAMWKSGDTIDEISQAYPHLQLAAIFDAISYYLDHRAEVESQIAENRIERVLKDSGATMDESGVITLPNG